MSSGAILNEDYSDPNSDIYHTALIFAMGGSLDKFTLSLKKDLEPGIYNPYNSTAARVVGMLLRESTGRYVTKFM